MKTVQVPFRLIAMECCEFNLLSIDADVPHYCPRCGTGYALHALPAVLTEDLQAVLIYTPSPIERNSMIYTVARSDD